MIPGTWHPVARSLSPVRFTACTSSTAAEMRPGSLPTAVYCPMTIGQSLALAPRRTSDLEVNAVIDAKVTPIRFRRSRRPFFRLPQVATIGSSRD